MKDTEITSVEFYVATFEDDINTFAEVIAVFYPKLGNSNNYSCYSRLGQHSICSQSFIAENCRKANETEYRDLFNELENSVGYNLNVL